MTETERIAAGEAAVSAGMAWWAEAIRDPKIKDKSEQAARDRTRITTWITDRAIGAGWASWQHGGKKDGKTCKSYCGDLCFSWCGVFAASCWGSVLKLEVRKRRFPSTFRLKDWADETERRIEIADIRAGDLVVVKTTGKLAFGDHITIARGPVANGICPTVEGNGGGL